MLCYYVFMASTIVPSKYATDINILKNTIQIKPIPSPKDFYEQPENQKQISAQIQQAANTRYSVAPPNQSVLPSKVVKDIVSNTRKSGLNNQIPVPTGQGKSIKGNTVNDINPIETKSPDVFSTYNTYFTAAGQDVNRAVDSVIDKSKLVLIAAAFIGAAIIFK